MQRAFIVRFTLTCLCTYSRSQTTASPPHVTSPPLGPVPSGWITQASPRVTSSHRHLTSLIRLLAWVWRDGTHNNVQTHSHTHHHAGACPRDTTHTCTTHQPVTTSRITCPHASVPRSRFSWLFPDVRFPIQTTIVGVWRPVRRKRAPKSCAHRLSCALDTSNAKISRFLSGKAPKPISNPFRKHPLSYFTDHTVSMRAVGVGDAASLRAPLTCSTL